MKWPLERTLKTKNGDTFEKCKEVIFSETQNGWRLKQVVIPTNEKMEVASACCYEIIFEKNLINQV